MSLSRLTRILSFTALLILSGAAQAITIDFDVEITRGDFVGTTGVGMLTYDETLLTGMGMETIGSVGSGGVDYQDPTFSIHLSIFGQRFSTSDDQNYPDWPAAEFFDGALEFLEFAVAEQGNNPIAITFPNVLSFGLGFVSFPNGAPALVEAFARATPVPEPSTLALAGLLVVGARMRRVKI